MCWFSEGSHFSQALERIADNRITRPIMFVGMVDGKSRAMLCFKIVHHSRACG